MKGVLIADQRGLCLTKQGVCSAGLGGSATALTSLAGQLEPEEGHPVILIESGVRKYLIKTEETVTVVIVKDL